MIKQINKLFPKFNRVAPFAFVPKSIYPTNTLAFMIASKQEHTFRILDLVTEKEAEGFDALFASVNVVAKKQIISIRRKACV